MNIEQIRAMAENMVRIGVCILLLIGKPFVHKDLPEIVKAFSDVGIYMWRQTTVLQPAGQRQPR